MNTTEQFMAKVANNLDSVANGLLHVKESVEAAGYAEALPGYQQMKQTLMQQRMLSLSMTTPEMQERWQMIGQAAADTQKILCAFGELLGEIAKIANMGAEGEATSAEQQVASSSEKK